MFQVTSTPRFAHDCDECVFLGQIGPDDLHFCESQYSVILRDGNEGQEYASFPRDIVAIMLKHSRTSDARWQVAMSLVEEYLETR